MNGNAAIKMSSDEVVKHFNDAYGNLDMLKVFMVTGSTDISKSYELIAKLAKMPANAEDKAMYEHALKILGRIAVKRVLLTEILYAPVKTGEELIELEEGASVITMFPKLDETLDRVKVALTKGNFSSESYKEAMDILNSTVKQGKVIDSSSKPVTWDNNQVNDYLTKLETELKGAAPAKTEKQTEKISFATLYNHASDLVKNGKTVAEVEEGIKKLVLGKIVGGKDATADVLVKDEEIFKDLYARMVSAYVEQTFKKKTAEDEGTKLKGLIDADVTKSIVPILQTLDKDETEKSLVKPAKGLVEIYEKYGLKMAISEAFKNVMEMATTLAPNLLKRHDDFTKVKMPVDKAAVADSPVAEVFDDSHDVKTTNPKVWEEAKDYKYLSQLYDKGIELSKAGLWRDALSLAITLITAGQILETDKATEPLAWDNDQIKLWYYNNVEIEVSKQSTEAAAKEPGTVDVNAEVIKDDKHAETEKPVAQQGPVLKAGELSKEAASSKLMKKREELKDKYSLKTVKVPCSHYTNKFVEFEVAIANAEQEPDLLCTEINLAKFLDEQRDLLVKSSNNIKSVRKAIHDKLNTVYELTHSEAKSIVDSLNTDATRIRKEAKQAAGNVPKQQKEAAKKELEKAPDDAKDDDVFYDGTLKLGTNVEIVKDGFLIQAPDDKYELDDEKDVTHIVVVKSGKIIAVDPQGDDVAASGEENSAAASDQGTQSAAIASASEPAASNTEGKGKTPLAQGASAEQQNSQAGSAEKDSKATTTPTENTGGAASSNSNDYTKGFEEIVNANKKVGFHKAIYEASKKFETVEVAKRVIFEVIDRARKDDAFKKSYLRGYYNSAQSDVLAVVQKAINNGTAVAAKA